MSTFLQLINTAKLELGIEGADLVSTTSQLGMNAKLVNWVAEADYAIQTLHFDWNFLWTQFTYSTVVGDSVITQPSDLGVWDTEAVWLDYTANTAARLNYVSYKEFVATQGYGVKTNSTPSLFTVRPDLDLKLDPPADAVYSITADYWKAPTKMADAADTSSIPAQYERVVILRTKMYFAEEEEFPQLYSMAQQEYLELLDKLEKHQLPELERQGLTIAPELTVRPL